MIHATAMLKFFMGLYFVLRCTPECNCASVNFTRIGEDENLPSMGWDESPTQRTELLTPKTKRWGTEEHQQDQNVYPPDEPSPTNEDYFASYDADYVNAPGNFSALIYDSNSDNAAIFPNPEMMVYDPERLSSELSPNIDINLPDILPEVSRPDDSLFDGDLREKNVIDSIQYVYFGRSSQAGASSPRMGKWRYAIPGGAFFGAVILIMTVTSVMKHKTFRNSMMFPIELNVISCFLVTDVLLMIGIGDTKSDIRCEIIALLLHYLHLVCASWIFVYCYVLSGNVAKGYIPNLRYNYLFAYGVPAILVMSFYAVSLESYEIRSYCWMSLEKGMLLGFMVPGTFLILLNTACAMVGLKAISKKQQEAIANTIENYIAQTIMSENVPRAATTASAPSVLDPCSADRFASPNSSVMSLERVPRRTLNEPEPVADKYRSYDDLEEERARMEGGSWMSTADIEATRSQSNRDVSTMKNMGFKIDLSSLSMDNLSWKTAEPEDMSDLRKCLNFALIMEPLYCVFWFMGVVALENSDQILPPFAFAFLWSHMHWFIFARFAYIHPFIPYEETITEAEEVNNSLHETNAVVHGMPKSTDTIPLLVTKTELPRESRDVNRPPDSISTISN